MLITFSSRILAKFQTGPPEILAAGKILTARNFVSRRKSRQHSHRDIRLPAKNPGKTPAGIPPRFWPPGIPPPAKNPGKIPAGIPPRFWPPGIPPPAKNPGKIPAGIPPRFWPPGIPPPAKNPAGILPRFWPPGIPPPAKNPGKNPGGNRESRRPKSRRDRGENLAGILPRSRQDPGTIFTRENLGAQGLGKKNSSFGGSVGPPPPRGALPIMAYTGRLCPKGVPFSGFRYIKG